MSAFIVSREHIRYLVDSIYRLRHLSDGDFTYYHNGKSVRVLFPGCDVAGGHTRSPEDLGRILWSENIRSVLHRYPYDTLETAPGPVGETYEYSRHRRVRKVTPEQTIRAADCLEYQSCEHPEWESSEAHSALYAIRRQAIRVMLEPHDLAWEIKDADNVQGHKARMAAREVR